MTGLSMLVPESIVGNLCFKMISFSGGTSLLQDGWLVVCPVLHGATCALSSCLSTHRGQIRACIFV